MLGSCGALPALMKAAHAGGLSIVASVLCRIACELRLLKAEATHE